MPYNQQCRKRSSPRAIAKLTRIKNRGRKKGDRKTKKILKMDIADIVIERGMNHSDTLKELGILI